MCIVDEFYERPTEPLREFRIEDRRVLAGQDLEGGGTWLGVNDMGLIAILTNSREAPLNENASISRGKLTEFVLGRENLDQVMEKIVKEKQNYANFNLLMIDNKLDLIKYIGSHDIAHPYGEVFTGDALSLSNGTLHSTLCKMQNGLSQIIDVVQRTDTKDTLQLDLMKVLTDPTKFPSNGLHKPHGSIVTVETEANLSSIYVRPCRLELSTPESRTITDRGLFGTVSSSLVLVNKDNSVDFVEVSWREYYKEYSAGTRGPPPPSMIEYFKKQKIERNMVIN